MGNNKVREWMVTVQFERYEEVRAATEERARELALRAVGGEQQTGRSVRVTECELIG